MNHSIRRRALVFVLACGTAGIFGYAAALAQADAGTDPVGPQLNPGAIVAKAGSDPEIIVQEYDDGRSICVEARVGRAQHFSCTSTEAEKPMLAFIDVDQGTIVVAVDPQGRIESLRTAGGASWTPVRDGKVVFSEAIVESDEDLVLEASDGALLVSFDLGFRGEIHSRADAAKDEEPHH